ncbi:hypothetical protein B0H63DRAFT_409639 [Podospora didyma]|uniref:Sedoheptulose-1,7-bisphosphatase n=1 Tax=Podospora didyma TaxID=330526 RepID=A0AAE0NY13_9PEZI|nr:hypothetical protein B0H63DRAFT_409639 [Podospora didyma]
MSVDAPPPSVADLFQTLLPSANTASLRDSVIPSLLQGIADIAQALRGAQHVARAGTANTFGDEQLNVDVVAENHVRQALERCPSVSTASSEEDPVERAVRPISPAQGEQYTAAFDPLDGSSIIAPNWTVGTIIGIWAGASALHALPSTSQICAILGVYGPRTTAIIALRLPSGPSHCIELGFTDSSGTWEIIRPSVSLTLPSEIKTRYFAPANLRAASEDPRYMALVTSYISQRYTLRYSGGLVPDIVHTLVKGHGIYLSPVTAGSKAKLRRLYELCPLALVVECAGGRAVDPANGTEVLARPVVDCNETAGLVCGTAGEVDVAISALLGAVN